MKEPNDPLADRLTDRLEQLAGSAQAHRSVDRVMSAAPSVQAPESNARRWSRPVVQVAAVIIVLAGLGAIVAVAAGKDSPAPRHRSR